MAPVYGGLASLWPVYGLSLWGFQFMNQAKKVHVFQLTTFIFQLTTFVFQLTSPIFQLTTSVFQLTTLVFQITTFIFQLTTFVFQLTTFEDALEQRQSRQFIIFRS